MPLRSPDVNPLVSISPECPRCHGPMAERVAKRGRNPGKKFWGCMMYSSGCRGSLPYAAGLKLIEEKRTAARKKIEDEISFASHGDDLGFLNFIDLE